MDTQLNESNDAEVQSDLEKFSNLLNPKEEVAEKAEEPAAPEVEAETEVEAPEKEADAITILVDGKEVTLTPEQIADAYKNGLRQTDYTKKTMEVAEERKQAESALQIASQERTAYADKLNVIGIQLQAALQEQSNINWDDLLTNDPVEYLKQQHLLQQRQATLQKVSNESNQLAQIQEEEQSKAFSDYLQAQQQELLAKLPAWKDDAKAKTERAEIKSFLMKEGFSENDISQVADHRHVLLIRDAMQFRKLLASTPEATKRVQTAPAKVERSGVTNDNGNNDAKKSAIKQFLRNPNSESAAINAFSALL